MSSYETKRLSSKSRKRLERRFRRRLRKILRNYRSRIAELPPELKKRAWRDLRRAGLRIGVDLQETGSTRAHVFFTNLLQQVARKGWYSARDKTHRFVDRKLREHAILTDVEQLGLNALDEFERAGNRLADIWGKQVQRASLKFFKEKFVRPGKIEKKAEELAEHATRKMVESFVGKVAKKRLRYEPLY